MPNPCSLVFSTSNSVISGDMYKTCDNSQSNFYSTHACTMHWIALNTVYSLLYWRHNGNWSMRMHCEQFDPDFRHILSFVLLFFALFYVCFYCIFRMSKFSASKIVFSVKFCVFFTFFENSVTLCLFPYRGKTGDLKLCYRYDDYSPWLNLAATLACNQKCNWNVT